MLIGEDYPKIEFHWLGLELLEPMAFITDSILGILSFVIAWRVHRLNNPHPLVQNWKWFFFVMGFATTTGGLAHLMYNYWGIWAKFPSWVIAPIALLFLERATLSVYPHQKVRKTLFTIVSFKYLVVLVIWLLICFSLDLSLPENEKKPFVPLALNSAIGAIGCTVLLTWWYGRVLHPAYRLFSYGTLIAVPSVFLIVMRIHPHQWFNGEDLGHVMMMATYIFSWMAIKRLSPILSNGS